ncbi:hypothetical protein CC2G_002802 [Coprinopsis cinerea AmutBmut pab1-1]|nr:hypothetical protein CC2G_002802 [Coprinopsis cinerea AmutBmut pab1-1]
MRFLTLRSDLFFLRVFLAQDRCTGTEREISPRRKYRVPLESNYGTSAPRQDDSGTTKPNNVHNVGNREHSGFHNDHDVPALFSPSTAPNQNLRFWAALTTLAVLILVQLGLGFRLLFICKPAGSKPRGIETTYTFPSFNNQRYSDE